MTPIKILLLFKIFLCDGNQEIEGYLVEEPEQSELAASRQDNDRHIQTMSDFSQIPGGGERVDAKMSGTDNKNFFSWTKFVMGLSA